MNQDHPYQYSSMPGASDAQAQGAMIEAFQRTRPWVFFLSILGFVGAAFMVIGGLVMTLVGAGARALAGSPLAGLGPVVGLFYVLLAIFYVIPAMLLWRYAASISASSAQGGSLPSLAVAVQKQASIWRFFGILTAVLLVLYALFFVGMLVVAVVGAAHH